jgi:hypothetical protein
VTTAPSQYCTALPWSITTAQTFSCTIAFQFHRYNGYAIWHGSEGQGEQSDLNGTAGWPWYAFFCHRQLTSLQSSVGRLAKSTIHFLAFYAIAVWILLPTFQVPRFPKSSSRELEADLLLSSPMATFSVVARCAMILVMQVFWHPLP